MKTETVIARIDLQTKLKIRKAAKEALVSESDLVRQLLVSALEGNGGERLYTGHPITSAGLHRKRITLTLPQFIVDLAVERAVSKDMALSRWIGALVQSHVFQPPVSTTAELKLLNESNRQLRAMGVNINQIARALNRKEMDLGWLGGLTGVERLIRENIELLRKLIQAINHSWGVNDGSH